MRKIEPLYNPKHVMFGVALVAFTCVGYGLGLYDRLKFGVKH